MARGIIIWGAMGVLIAAGAATAQEAPETPPLANHAVTLQASPSNSPVVPITEVRVTSVNITVTCEQASVTTGNPVQVTYGVASDHPAATVTASKLTTNLAFTTEGCLQGMTLDDGVDVAVAFAQGARAGETATVTLTASLSDGTSEEVTWEHTVGVYFTHQAQLDQTVWKAEPGAMVAVPGTVENFGNAPVRFVFDVLPDDARRLTVTMPEPIVVQPSASETFEIQVTTASTDSYVDRRDTLHFRIQALLEADHSVTGSAQDLSAVVQTQGGAAESPGPVMPGLAVLAMALLVGRRRTVSRM